MAFQGGVFSGSAVLLRRVDLAVPGILVSFGADYGLAEPGVIKLLAIVRYVAAVDGSPDLRPALGSPLSLRAALDATQALAPAADGLLRLVSSLAARIRVLCE